MLKYVVRRLLATIPVLFGLSIVLFAFVHLLPGDPAAALLGQHATPELTAQIRAQLHLDDPLWQQYLAYLNQLLHGDLGKSVINNRSVISELALRFPGTIELTAAALLFAVGLGIPLGRIAARHAQGWADGVVTVISLLGISIPIFILGYTLQYFLSVQLKLLPTSGRI
ncbi:MAG TPA: ABC transporter permease, partial [Candidatus Limnocylindrales bacterium]|nr:ABC transporter permease [Candidatus Limnocylindrales bacterium]